MDLWFMFPLLYPVSIAPMMDRTDRHCRFFLRQMTRRSLLYTEMVVTQAIVHGDRSRLLDFDAMEKPLALQLGGDDPQQLAWCAQIAESWGYDEVNLNVGCPSDRVQSGNFGACLMAQPERVAAAVARMRSVVAIPVTVKHRIGIDDLDSYDHLHRFVEMVAAAGCERFTVHARKAWLQGLSPKENRTIPPLKYDWVYRLKQDFPRLIIEVNGGITTTAAIADHLTQVDGVMIGRAAYDDPCLLATVDREFFGEMAPPPTRRQVVEAMVPYVERWCDRGLKLHAISRHLLGLFAGQPGTKAWKRHISLHACRPGASAQVLLDALAVAEEKQMVRSEHSQNVSSG